MKLRDAASVIRTKNAGPYIYTIDVMFEDEWAFEMAKKVITPDCLARIYGIPVRQVMSVMAYPAGRCVKANIRRPVTSGDIYDTDVLGMQQHAPMLDVELPL